MSDKGADKALAASLQELRVMRVLRGDPRYCAALELSGAGKKITAPAFTQERSAAEVIGGTLSGVARAEAARASSQDLPQNKLKSLLDTKADVLAEESGKGVLLVEKM